jgi:hypothetical protein
MIALVIITLSTLEDNITDGARRRGVGGASPLSLKSVASLIANT